jgi:hypothetical protein
VDDAAPAAVASAKLPASARPITAARVRRTIARMITLG